MMSVRAYVYRLLLGIWVGSLLSFGAVVAPALFQVLPPERAGEVVRRVLPILEGYGVFAALALLFFAQPRTGGRTRWIRSGLISAMGLMAALSLFAVSPAMAKLRQSTHPGKISELSSSDPLRRRYGLWHAFSSALAAGQLVLGVVAIGFDVKEQSGQS